MSLNPTIMQSCIDFAEDVFVSRKKRLIGSKDNNSGDMSFFYFRKDKPMVAIPDYDSMVNGKINIPPKEQVNCFNRIMTIGTDAQAVVMVSEVWFSTRCASCGKINSQADKCSNCGFLVDSIAPSQNPYSTEGIMANLEIKGYDKSMVWASESQLEDGKIVSWKDVYTCKSMDMKGRFAKPWIISDWMVPHLAYNIMKVADYFNCELPKDIKNKAREVCKIIPENFPVLSLKLTENG